MSGGDNPKSRSRLRMSSVNKHDPLDSEVETVGASTPLMGDTNKSSKPSLATPDIDEGDDDREVVTKHEGDDGSLNNKNSDKSVSKNSTHNNPETETDTSVAGSERDHIKPHDLKPEENIPDHTGEHSDEIDGVNRPKTPRGLFSHFGLHNHHHDMELGSVVLDEIPDINVYQHKKTLAQGMMDLALFSANANQLRYVLDSYDRHPYYYPSLIFICFSLLTQVAIGILLIWNATYNVKDEKEVCRANKINNYTVIGIFLVTIINVFISAFGVADPPSAAVAVTPSGGNST